MIAGHRISCSTVILACQSSSKPGDPRCRSDVPSRWPFEFTVAHRQKERARIALLGAFAQKIVKARQHKVVLMQDMHPISTSPLNASIPSICQTPILGFGVERHPARANAASNFGSGIIRSSSRQSLRSASAPNRGPAAERSSTFAPGNLPAVCRSESLRTSRDAANFPLVMEISAVDLPSNFSQRSTSGAKGAACSRPSS